MENYYEIECDECEGTGYYDVLDYCLKPISECCGGCTHEVKCETCNGTGYVELEDE